jgi:hypothetical protein
MSLGKLGGVNPSHTLAEHWIQLGAGIVRCDLGHTGWFSPKAWDAYDGPARPLARIRCASPYPRRFDAIAPLNRKKTTRHGDFFAAMPDHPAPIRRYFAQGKPLANSASIFWLRASILAHDAAWLRVRRQGTMKISPC